MDEPIKEPNLLLIDIIDGSQYTVKEVAKKAMIGYTHLVRMKNDKRIKPQRTTIKMLENVLGRKVRRAFWQ